MPKNCPERVDAIDGALGELSPFHNTFGFYVHGVPITAAILPLGWDRRTVEVRNANTRGKDRDFVRVLLAEAMVRPRKLIERIQRLPLSEDRIHRLMLWVDTTVREL